MNQQQRKMEQAESQAFTCRYTDHQGLPAWAECAKQWSGLALSLLSVAAMVAVFIGPMLLRSYFRFHDMDWVWRGLNLSGEQYVEVVATAVFVILIMFLVLVLPIIVQVTFNKAFFQRTTLSKPGIPGRTRMLDFIPYTGTVCVFLAGLSASVWLDFPKYVLNTMIIVVVALLAVFDASVKKKNELLVVSGVDDGKINGKAGKLDSKFLLAALTTFVASFLQVLAFLIVINIAHAVATGLSSGTQLFIASVVAVLLSLIYGSVNHAGPSHGILLIGLGLFLGLLENGTNYVPSTMVRVGEYGGYVAKFECIKTCPGFLSSKKPYVYVGWAKQGIYAVHEFDNCENRGWTTKGEIHLDRLPWDKVRELQKEGVIGKKRCQGEDV